MATKVATKEEKVAAKELEAAVKQTAKEAETTEALRLQTLEVELKAKHAAEAAAVQIQLDAAKEAAKEVPGREKRWKELLATYEKQNPVKYAAKKERGEFKEIPASFI